MVIAFSGHRPEKLPWGGLESDLRCAALKVQIARAVAQAADGGGTRFLCGMARGCDMWFAESVLELAKTRQEISLEAWLPCPSQPDCWPEEEQIRYRNILTQCDKVYMVEQNYSDGCMLRRNRMMVDACDVLITVWDGRRGGTGSTVSYARRKGKEIRGLWL